MLNHCFPSCRSGKLCKGDQILSINGRSLAGMSHNAAIKLLQKAKGSVELKIVRSVTSAVPSPELHPIDLAVDDKVNYSTGIVAKT